MPRVETSARLEVFSDRELLAIVWGQRDGDGWTDSFSIAGVVFPEAAKRGPQSESAKSATRSVSNRMSWMRRFGIIERGEGKPAKWKLTPAGVAFMRGTLKATQENMLARINPSQYPTLAAYLATMYQQTDETTANVMRREWRHGTFGR